MSLQCCRLQNFNRSIFSTVLSKYLKMIFPSSLIVFVSGSSYLVFCSSSVLYFLLDTCLCLFSTSRSLEYFLCVLRSKHSRRLLAIIILIFISICNDETFCEVFLLKLFTFILIKYVVITIIDLILDKPDFDVTLNLPGKYSYITCTL